MKCYENLTYNYYAENLKIVNFLKKCIKKVSEGFQLSKISYITCDNMIKSLPKVKNIDFTNSSVKK